MSVGIKERVLNKALIRQIVVQIKATPGAWNQKDWVQHNCQTKRCFAGWALFLAGYTDSLGTPTEAGWKLFHDNELGSFVSFLGLDDSGRPRWHLPYGEAAAIVLGISDDVADQLFDGSAASFYAPGKRGEYGEWVDNDLKTFLAKITDLTGIKDFRIRTKVAKSF